ncbi:hypothetical protein GQ53DRAFT_782549 [Thozetella sp. PMI_491]|nr:hypothetical protein GQ53DRAFT_782549 [Thozetella sp. PMI_491]
MSVNLQAGSSFINKLPREIREVIYLEIWRSCGIRQHIQWHGKTLDEKHICRWPCSTEFSVHDQLQQDVEELRKELKVPLGNDICDPSHPNTTLYCRRLQSPWMNHWLCGEHAERDHGSCNSAECLQSIYQSTTFVFTDLFSVQVFFGFCALHSDMERLPKIGPPPPAFFKYARSWELSLSADFPTLLACANTSLPGIDRHHEVYDFHWLRFNQFQSLQSIKIWIAARSFSCRIDSDNSFLGIKQFDADGLKKLLACFENVRSFVLSTPLASSVGPDEGYVDKMALPGIWLYKRGTGDRFHPFLTFIDPGGTFDRRIYTTAARYRR